MDQGIDNHNKRSECDGLFSESVRFVEGMEKR